MDRLIVNGVEIVASVAMVLAVGVALLALEELLVVWKQTGVRPAWKGPRGLVRGWWGMFSRLFGDRPTVGTSVVLVAVIALFSVLPWAGWTPMQSVDGGLLVLLAIHGLAVWGLLWDQEDLSGIDRAARWSQLQLSLAASVTGVVLLSGSLGLHRIVEAQTRAGVWWVVVQPIGLGLFVLCTLESTRVVDGESQRRLSALVRQLQLLALAYVCVNLFFGGWGPAMTAPGLGDVIVSASVLHAKVVLVLAGLMALRRVSWADHTADVVTNGTFLAAVGFANLFLTVALRRMGDPEARLVPAIVMWSGLAMLVGAGYLVNRRGVRTTNVVGDRGTGE